MRWLGVAAALLALTVPARADIAVTISKSQQRMAVSVDGGAPMIWTVSTGRDGYTTPSGSFRAIRLEEVYYSKKYDDAPMPNSVFFYGGYAIHGTLEERRLGNPVSHGCVRLARANAAELFHLVRAHGMSRTRITVTDGPLGRFYDAPMARGFDRQERYQERGNYDRTFAARSVYDPRFGAQRGTVQRPDSRYDSRATRSFDDFGRRGYAEPQRRVYWNDEPRARNRDSSGRGLVRPGDRTYSQAELRRMYYETGRRY